MGHITALGQDIKREVGNEMELRGKIGELNRLQKRIESGSLTHEELYREMNQFQEVALDLAQALDRRGYPELADEAFDIADFGPRDGFNMPDMAMYQGPGGKEFEEVANQILGQYR